MLYKNISNTSYNRAVYTEPWAYWDDAFTSDELKKLIEQCDSMDFIRAKVGSTENSKDVEKIRKSNITWLHRNEETKWIFDKVNFMIHNINDMFYNFELNGYDSLQYTVYDGTEEGHYDWHMDMFMGQQKTEFLTRKLSFTMLLDGDFEGGAFQINTGKEKSAITVETRPGRAILFPSFVIHRVTPILKGTRKSLVAWCTGPKFR
jgi:PKHD-type hydroxylase